MVFINGILSASRKLFIVKCFAESEELIAGLTEVRTKIIGKSWGASPLLRLATVVGGFLTIMQNAAWFALVH